MKYEILWGFFSINSHVYNKSNNDTFSTVKNFLLLSIRSLLYTLVGNMTRIFVLNAKENHSGWYLTPYVQWKTKKRKIYSWSYQSVSVTSGLVSDTTKWLRKYEKPNEIRGVLVIIMLLTKWLTFHYIILYIVLVKWGCMFLWCL